MFFFLIFNANYCSRTFPSNHTLIQFKTCFKFLNTITVFNIIFLCKLPLYKGCTKFFIKVRSCYVPENSCSIGSWNTNFHCNSANLSYNENSNQSNLVIDNILIYFKCSFTQRLLYLRIDLTYRGSDTRNISTQLSLSLTYIHFFFDLPSTRFP